MASEGWNYFRINCTDKSFAEREEANTLFKSKKGKELQRDIAKKAKTFVPGGNLPDAAKPSGPTPQELWKIRDAISKASSLEEVERLNRLLQSGQIPGRARPPWEQTGHSASAQKIEEEVEEPMETNPSVNGTA